MKMGLGIVIIIGVHVILVMPVLIVRKQLKNYVQEMENGIIILTVRAIVNAHLAGVGIIVHNHLPIYVLKTARGIILVVLVLVMVVGAELIVQ